MKKFIDSFHYLTQEIPGFSPVQQAEMACRQGAKWIQYRSLSKPDDELLQDLHQIASICDEWGTTLIVTEHLHLLEQADIQGVHIENMDADLSLVRKQIGPDKTLGASANTLEQILKHIKNGVDYIGCGPFGHTDTKPNNCQHWGIKGYKDVISQLQQQQFDIPLIAAGGVTEKDIPALMETGIHGVAVSAAINKSPFPAETYRNIYKMLH